MKPIVSVLFFFLLSVMTHGSTSAIAQELTQTLPPDPGPAGKKTLEGIDSDNDGVRDDVQCWIALTYPNSEKTRAALSQGTIVMQQILLDAADPIKSYNNALESGNAVDCLNYVRADSARVGAEIEAVFLNTYLRSKAWLQADAHLSGHMFKGLGYKNWKQGCNFDPDTMPN